MKVEIPLESVMHRNNMNEQFITHYDDASSRWFDMIENKTIPLATEEDKRYEDIMKRTLGRLLKNPDITPLDQDMVDEIIEEELFDYEEDEFKLASPPKDKNKLH